jgi:hypothetical protein
MTEANLLMVLSSSAHRQLWLSTLVCTHELETSFLALGQSVTCPVDAFQAVKHIKLSLQ